METALVAIASLYWAATWATLGYGILRRCGRGADGLMLGLFLGPLGCAIAVSLSSADPGASVTLKTMRVTSTSRRPAYPCPYCGVTTTSHGLVTCRCGREFEAP
jgi:hypothetical protein